MDLTALVTEPILTTTARRRRLPMWLLFTTDIVQPASPWKRADDERLRQQLGVIPVTDIATTLSRTISDVDHRAALMGLPWQPLSAGRDEYTLPLVKYLLGVNGRVLAKWAERGFLVVAVKEGERLVKRGDLYRLLSIPEVRLDPAWLLDPRLRQVWLRRQSEAGRRPADAPTRRFTPGEDTLLGRGLALGLGTDLLAPVLDRPERELITRRPVIANLAGLPSWKQGEIGPLVEAIVRYEAGQASRPGLALGGAVVPGLAGLL